jgi:hypothetical protein
MVVSRGDAVVKLFPSLHARTPSQVATGWCCRYLLLTWNYVNINLYVNNIQDSGK